MQIKINTMNPSHCHSTTYSHFHYNHLLLHRSENSSLIPLCVLVCSFFVSFIFCIFIPKILFCFLKKVILVRCWEKYRPLINSTLSGYKTAVSSSGMQDHLLASPSSVLGGIPIPTVSTLTQVALYQPGLSALEGRIHTSKHPYRRGWERKRSREV